jgi:hypothetical protein
MPAITFTEHCPHWCVRDHTTDSCGVLYHAGQTGSVAIAQPDGLLLSDRLDVQVAQYLPEDPQESVWPPTVEITVPAAGRYRLIGLTQQQARELARLLAESADQMS